MEYASKGVAGAALGTGIAGLALGVLNGGLGGLGKNGNTNPIDLNINAPDVEVARLRAMGYYGGGCGLCGYGQSGHYTPVNHHELNLVREISAKDAIIVDKDAKLYTNKVVCEAKEEIYRDLNAFKLETANRFCYDEKLIAENKCEIEKTNINLESNYYKMKKVIRPWDICPAVELKCKDDNNDRD